jgi:hypothetical protein
VLAQYGKRLNDLETENARMRGVLSAMARWGKFDPPDSL